MTAQPTSDTTAEQDSFAVTLIKAIPKSPYDDLGLYQQILSNRTALGGRLFIDLMAADIVALSPQSPSDPFPFETWNTLYPPQNKAGLTRLLQTIENNTPTGTRAASLIYYLFLDYPQSLLPPGESLAKYYAEVTDLPQAYLHLVQGLHALDTRDYVRGLAALADPDIVPSYTEQIVAAFIRAQTQSASIHTSTAAAAAASAAAKREESVNSDNSTFLTGGYSLAIAYMTAKAPQIVTQPVIEAYVKVLCQTSLYAALDFIRCVDDISPSKEQAEPLASRDPYDDISAKTALLKVMIDSVLVFKHSPKSSLQSPSKRLFKAAPMAWRFANLPFSVTESRTVATILLNIVTLSNLTTSTESSSFTLKNNLERASMAKDILLLRALHTGETDLAVKVAALGGSSRSGITKTNGKYGELDFSDLARGVEIWDNGE